MTTAMIVEEREAKIGRGILLTKAGNRIPGQLEMTIEIKTD